MEIGHKKGKNHIWIIRLSATITDSYIFISAVLESGLVPDFCAYICDFYLDYMVP